jgi:hypothetical protein
MLNIYPISFRFISLVLLSFALIFLDNPSLQSATVLQHNPQDSLNSGHRLFISVTADDTEQIETVRIYFKSGKTKDFYFITLRNDVRSQFIGRLPAATPDCKELEYLILVRNKKRQLIRSQKYTIPVTDSRISVSSPADRIHIFTELPELRTTIPGFSDNFTLHRVKPSLQYGRMAGLYTTKQESADTVFATNVTATPSTGISSTTLAAAGATFFAVSVGGVAISFSNNSSGDNQNIVQEEEKKTACPFTGNWRGMMEIPECAPTRSRNINWRGTVDERCIFTADDGNLRGYIETTTGEITMRIIPELLSCDPSGYQTTAVGSQGIFNAVECSGVFLFNGQRGKWVGRRN